MDRKYLCQPCDHKHWWQHRHPDPTMRAIGFAMMVFGVVNIAIALSTLIRL